MKDSKDKTKKKYRSPHLTKYGTFKKLTQGSRTRNNDVMSTSGANKTRSSTG
jgi:hypothetical protein